MFSKVMLAINIWLLIGFLIGLHTIIFKKDLDEELDENINSVPNMELFRELLHNRLFLLIVFSIIGVYAFVKSKLER